MPLLDHFHPPISMIRHWSEVSGQWPGEIVRTLFDLLPEGYQAGPRLYLGSSFEVDISVAEKDWHRTLAGTADEGGTATIADVVSPFTVLADQFDFDEYEVRIYDNQRQRTLVAAIEIISPSNKDRPESRRQFCSKVAALLREGVSVTVVDLVTERQANLYVELLEGMGQHNPHVEANPSAIYAVTLRTRKPRKGPSLLDAWYYPLTLGQPLPTVPLWLSPDLRIELPLEPSYSEVCRLLRIA